MSAGPLNLDTRDFWFDPYRTEDEVIHELAAGEFLGLVLDGPAVVDVSRTTTLPIQGVRAEEARVALALPGFSQAALVVGVQLERNRARVDSVTDRRVERPRRGDLDPGDARSYESFRFNLRARLGLRWEPSSWAVWVLLRDQLSNRVLTRLVQRAEPAYVDPVVAAFVDEHKKTPYPQPIWPRPAPPPKRRDTTQALPHYRELEGSPPLPSEPGVALATERVQVVEDGLGGCVLRGSFRLEALPREVVREREESDEDYAALLALQGTPPQSDEPPPTAAERKGVPYLKDTEVEWPSPPAPPAPREPSPARRPGDAWGFADQGEVADSGPEGPWESGHVWQDVGDDDATAVIPITLVVVGAELNDPFVLNLRVPSYEAVGPDGGEVCGWFTIDLLGFRESYAMRGQTSWIYAFSGKHASGPCAVALLQPGSF